MEKDLDQKHLLVILNLLKFLFRYLSVLLLDDKLS